MDSFEHIELGTYRGDTYFLMGFVEPEPAEGEDYDPDVDADNYGIALVRDGTDPTTDNIEIVRMDTAHEQPHLDKVYLPEDSDAQRKVWLEDGYTYERMRKFLLANWRDFANRYIKHHE